MNMEDDASGGFEKLGFLLTSSPMPPETFGNLLLLYCKYGYYDLAADVLAENQHLVDKYLDKVYFPPVFLFLFFSPFPVPF
jgi:tetratricopeptide repeat protein 30